MLRSMTAREFECWKIAYRFDPWGEERGDLRAGIIASASVSPHCKRGQSPAPSDFMPQFGPDAEKGDGELRPKQSEEEMRSQFNAFKRVVDKKAIKDDADGS